MNPAVDPVMDYILGWSTPALILLVLGLILMVCEMFTPGLGLCGAFGGLCLLGAIVLRADSLTTALITLILILVPLMIAAGIIFRSFSKGVLGRSKIVLKDSIEGESTSLGGSDAQSLIGLEGECVTALRPVGAGEFGGKRLDIVSEGGFIQKGARVRITAIDGVRIMVKEI